MFPLIILALCGCFKFALDAGKEVSRIVFEIDRAIFLLTVGLTARAYYKTLFLMFRRGTLKKKSIQLVKEKMKESVDYSIDTRLGNNILMTALEELNGGVEVLLERQSASVEHVTVKQVRLTVLPPPLRFFHDSPPYSITIKPCTR